MMRLAAEAWVAVRGSWRLLTFKPDWQDAFDVSLAGFWRSFSAAIFALPLIALILAGAWHANGTISLPEYAVSYLLSWIVFPLAAIPAVMIAGARDALGRWIVVHNWAVLWLYALQAGIFTLHTAGLIDGAIMQLLFTLYIYVRILVHWRIAYAALGLPTITSALVAAVPILAGHIVSLVIFLLFYSAPEAAPAVGG